MSVLLQMFRSQLQPVCLALVGIVSGLVVGVLAARGPSAVGTCAQALDGGRGGGW